MAGIDEADLFRRLDQVSPELAARIRRLGDIVDPLLNRIYSIFPAYTDHGRSHSEQVMTILSWLLPDDMAEPLSDREMFYLLAAAFLHDIGMLEAVDKVGDREAQKQIRDSHHLRSQQYVNENYERLGLNKPEASAIGEICRAHRKIDIAEEVRDVSDSGGAPVRMQLLSAAVRIADELHLTADRAPQIVLDAIKPPQDSLAHFMKHLGIGSVGPFDSSEGIIRINATAETLAQERSLRQMADEIQAKLSEVEPIFARHDLPWKTIDLDLQRRAVIERKVVLHLARLGEAHKGELVANLGESPEIVEACVRDLMHWHHIESGEDSSYVRLVADSHTFEHWLRRFLNTEEEIQFVLSPYLRKCIEEFAFDDCRQRFGAFYDIQEREDRILALQSSPTALRLLLFVSEFQVGPAIIRKTAALDGAILLGFLTDVFRFPQIAQIRGVAPAIGAIHAKIGQESQHLLRLLSALGPDLGRDFRDVFNDLVPPRELEDTDSEDRAEFRMTVSHPRIAIESGMTFPHLLKAAMVSGESLELVGDRIRLSSEDPRLSEATASPPDYFVITPHPRRSSPQSGIMFCRVEIDHVRKRITLFADIERSTDYSRYPIAIRMTIPPDRRNATFRLSAYLTNIDVQQALQIDEMFRWIKSGDFHRLRIEPDQTGLLAPDTMSLEALGPDVKDQTVEPFLDDSHCEVLQRLAHLQDRTGERIPLPIGFTTQQKAAIIALAEDSDDMSAPQILDELLLIAEQSKNDWTTIRVSTYFPNEQIESDEFLGPFLPRIIPKIETKRSEINQQLAEMLQKGEGAIRITDGFALDLATLRKTIVESFSEDGDRAFLPPRSESEQATRTVCQVTIQLIQDKMWYREQVIHYQIRDVSGVRSVFSSASNLLKQDRVREAIDELTAGLKRFPNDAFLTGLLGWAYYGDGDLHAAYSHSLNAVNLQDEKWSVMRVHFAYYNLGLCSLRLGRFEESMSWYEEAVRSDPGEVLDESIEDLEAVLTTEIPEAFYALAFLYEHKGDLAKAIKLCGQFLNSDSQHEKYKELAQAAIERLEQSEQAQ